MHAEPPLQGDDRSFRRLDKHDHQRQHQRHDDRGKRCERQRRLLDERDDDRSHDMPGDRKSTRPELQSLMRISFGVFFLKKKKLKYIKYYTAADKTIPTSPY